MRVTTWIDRVTDESNFWFIAQKLEDSGKFSQAAVYFLRDATACLNRNHLVRAALSCSCAASCIERLGNSPYVQQLFREAAMIYSDYSSVVIGRSTRDYIWGLQRSYECFLLGYDDESASRIHEAIVAFEKRMNPFAGKASMADQSPVVHDNSVSKPTLISKEPLVFLDNTEVVRSAEAFFEARRNLQGRQSTKQSMFQRKGFDSKKNGKNIEKSIIGQLG